MARSSLVALWATCVAICLLPEPARAYPWMIAHQYTTCSQCHIDPSGGSALTAYGRAQTEALLRTHYGTDPAEEPGKIKDFLFGVVPLPDIVVAQVDVRGLFIPQPDDPRLILMQADLRGGIHTESFTAYVGGGVVSEGARAARIVSDEDIGAEAVTPVLRDYWVAYRPNRSLTFRAGRMNLPFGIRTDQHILYTRAATRTSTNADQQLGVSVAVEQRKWRGELMAIAGNYQVRPDAFRERGYSAMAALAASQRLELGASSLVTGSGADVATSDPTIRQAHGVFSRYSPVEGVAIMAEVDALVTTTGAAGSRVTAPGVVLDVHGDWEALRGVHIKAGGELCDPDLSAADGAASRGWGAVQWFFAPHVNLRVDALLGPLACDPAAPSRAGGFAQIHAFL